MKPSMADISIYGTSMNFTRITSLGSSYSPEHNIVGLVDWCVRLDVSRTFMIKELFYYCLVFLENNLLIPKGNKNNKIKIINLIIVIFGNLILIIGINYINQQLFINKFYNNDKKKKQLLTREFQLIYKEKVIFLFLYRGFFSVFD